MSEHLDLDALSDVLAGVPSSHLDNCEQCRTEVDALLVAMGPVATALAGLPDPEPPADLEQRLVAAIADERRAQTAPTAPVTAGTSATATVTPLASARRPLARWLPAAAGVAAAAALVVGGVVLAEHEGSGSRTTTASPPPYQTNNTGSNYRKDGALLARELPTLLTKAEKSASTLSEPSGQMTDARTPRSGLAPADALARLRTTAGLASCLASLSDANDPGLPLALDYATFEGQPALVVVLPAAKADKVDLFVVGAGCAQADAKLLFFTRLTKPT